eukprot:gene29845-36965_t
MALKNNGRLGDQVWGKMAKNAELFTLTYGSLVMQLIKDFEDVALVNEQLEKMGHNIVAFKMFLGISPDVSGWNKESNSFSLIFSENPLVEFVEIPPQYQDLQYCSILVGIIKGALEMVQLQVDVRFVKDILRGDDITELRVEFKGLVKNVMSDEYKEN